MPHLEGRSTSPQELYQSNRTEKVTAPEKEIPERLGRQLDKLLDLRNDVLENRHERRSPKEKKFIKQTFTQVIEARQRRAKELASPEGKEAAEIAQRLLPDTYFITCIDSRVHRTIAYGLPLGINGVMRRPAGDMSADFDHVDSGGLIVKEKSPLAEALNTALDKSSTGVVIEVFDSHVGCAARDGKEKNKKRQRKDQGLLEDVKRKKDMAAGVRFYESRPPYRKYVETIQTSFDPHNGYMYMGLEKEDILEDVERKVEGFSPKVLAGLVTPDDPEEYVPIISTEKLVKNPRIQRIFDAHPIEEFDWDSNYLKTLNAFWKNMDAMLTPQELNNDAEQDIGEDGFSKNSTLFEIIYREVNGRAFREDKYSKDHEEEIRVKLLAFNAYNAYNLNKGEKISTEENKYPNYPYAIHEESIVVVSEEENGPFNNADHSAFVVFSNATNDYSINIGLATGLILNNREAGTIQDTTGQFEDDLKGYLDAPVPVKLQVIIREEDTDWNELREIIEHDKFLPNNWQTMDSQEYGKHIAKLSPKVDMNIFVALDTMRQQMTALYNSDDIKDGIFDGSLEVLPMFVDKDRNQQAIAPFVYRGCKLEY